MKLNPNYLSEDSSASLAIGPDLLSGVAIRADDLEDVLALQQVRLGLVVAKATTIRLFAARSL